MRWTADPPRPFQLRPAPICSALRYLVASLLPAFIYRRVSRLSQGIACSYRVTLMVRPLLLAEPGPGDAPCTTWTLSVFFHPLYLQAGRPSSRFALCSFPVFQLSPHASGLSTFSVRFRPFDFLRTFPVLRLSSYVFQSFDLLRSSCDPNLTVGGFLSNGVLKLLLKDRIVKTRKWLFRVFF